MKIHLINLLLFLSISLSNQVIAQDIFPLGVKAPNVNHTGDVWLSHVSEADETFDYNIAHVVMAPGAKLNWHLHPAGQQLLITKGVGYYQEKGKAVQVVRKGDLIKCEPNVEHWHAASPDNEVAYLAISGNKPTQWTEELTQEAYDAIEAPEAEKTDQAIIDLSKQKWQWMADKDVEQLKDLFHEKAVFVHMGGSWGKERELNIIEDGGIWYKEADVHEVSVNIIDNTAILLNRITLVAEVGGNEVTNPFEVTEVYVQENGDWKLSSLSFTRLMTR
ncbi:MAG: DUF4440 domain-containing protein [Candidatus Cyclobacteriaceae bacterium M2_1C_046]